MIRERSLIILLLALSVSVQGCSGRHEPNGSQAGPAPVVKGTVLETVQTATVPEQLEVVGTVRSRNSAVVLARIAGAVSGIKVREGDQVRQGQLLATLESRESLANAAAAAAGVDEARRGLDEAGSRKQLADITFDRFQKLYQEQAVTRQELDVKRADRDLAWQGLARAEARLRQATESGRAADALAGYTRITAPISGVVTSRQIDPGSTVFPAQPMFAIEDGGSYQLELAIPEAASARVKIGTTVRITIDALAMTTEARVVEIVPALDPASRTYTAKIALAGRGFRSGMFGRGAINLGAGSDGIVIPRSAVSERGALTSVWVADKDNLVRMRLIKTGRNIGGRVEVLAGLAAGERIAVSGIDKLSDGAKVE